jgi:starch-binding outer membrane protein SusE/F
MYLVGAATAYGWDAPGSTDDALMHKIAGGAPNEGVFWKIAHLQAGEGFKLSAAGWADPNLGYNEVDAFDADGLMVGEDGGNMTVDESGMFIIVLDLRNEMVKVSIKEAAVYGIGDAFGGWDAGVAANKFTVDNVAKTLTSPPLPANGNIRMYADHTWIPDWWNAEFVVVGTDIEYRNDSNDDPTAVAGTAGQIITLHFDDNTGSID